MTLFVQNLLSLLIWLPIFGGLALLLIGDDGNARSARAGMMRLSALLITALTFVLSTALYAGFDNAESGMQFIERASWIAAVNAYYYLGVDGISTPLILLTTFITPLVVLAGWDSIKSRPAQYFAAFLILEGLMIGVFAALDGLLFYVFWEAMLVPMFLIIGIWGGERRVYATIKFFLYTFLGSVLMLVAFIYLYGKTGGFDLLGFMNVPLSLLVQQLIFLAFLRGVCRQGADVAGAHLAAGRPCGGADRWLGDPGGDHVEDGRLRFRAPVAADRARRLRVFCQSHDRRCR